MPFDPILTPAGESLHDDYIFRRRSRQNYILQKHMWSRSGKHLGLKWRPSECHVKANAIGSQK
jgi:hypothetical protein